MRVRDIVNYLNEYPGNLKEGKVRLCRILRNKGYKVNEHDCAVALRVANNPQKYEMEMGDRKFRRLFFDIETSPNIGTFWRPGYKITLRYDNIIKHNAVICISYKWEDEDKVHNLRWHSPNGEWDDSKMLEEFAEIVKQADEVVAHNGDRFDIKWLRTRCLYHGIKFPAFIKTLDTLPKVKYFFNFPTNHLNDIGRYLGVGQKLDTDYDLWVDVCLNHNQEKLQYMIDYCNMDVVLLQDVYEKIKSYVDSNTHQGMHKGKAKWTCPQCGSENVEYIKPAISGTGNITGRVMECKECGHTYKISNTEYRKFIDVT